METIITTTRSAPATPAAERPQSRAEGQEQLFFQLLDASIPGAGATAPGTLGGRPAEMPAILPGSAGDGLDLPPGGQFLPLPPGLAEGLGLATVDGDSLAAPIDPATALVAGDAGTAPPAPWGPIEGSRSGIEAGRPLPAADTAIDLPTQLATAVRAAITTVAAGRPASTEATVMADGQAPAVAARDLLARVAEGAVAAAGPEGPAEAGTEPGPRSAAGGFAQALAAGPAIGPASGPTLLHAAAVTGADPAAEGGLEPPRVVLPQPRLAVAPGEARWGEAVGQRLTWLASNGGGRAEIQLDPPELGRLQVGIEIRGESAQVHFQSDQAPVREALDSALPRLREMLNQAGFSDLQFDVSQGGADERHAGAARSDDAGPGRTVGAEGEAETAAGRPTLAGLAGNGLVDLYA